MQDSLQVVLDMRVPRNAAYVDHVEVFVEAVKDSLLQLANKRYLGKAYTLAERGSTTWNVGILNCWASQVREVVKPPYALSEFHQGVSSVKIRPYDSRNSRCSGLFGLEKALKQCASSEIHRVLYITMNAGESDFVPSTENLLSSFSKLEGRRIAVDIIAFSSLESILDKSNAGIAFLRKLGLHFDNVTVDLIPFLGNPNQVSALVIKLLSRHFMSGTVTQNVTLRLSGIDMKVTVQPYIFALPVTDVDDDPIEFDSQDSGEQSNLVLEAVRRIPVATLGIELLYGTPLYIYPAEKSGTVGIWSRLLEELSETKSGIVFVLKKGRVLHHYVLLTNSDSDTIALLSRIGVLEELTVPLCRQKILEPLSSEEDLKFSNAFQALSLSDYDPRDFNSGIHSAIAVEQKQLAQQYKKRVSKRVKCDISNKKQKSIFS